MPGATAPVYTRQQEALARQNGFPNYDAMRLFELQKMRQRTAQTTGAGGGELLPGAPKTVSSAAQGMLSWHPAVVLQNIANKLKSVISPDE